MIFLLDINVVSELWKPAPEARVLAWVAAADWRVPVPVVAEIQEGAEAVASAARRKEINTRLDVFLRRHRARSFRGMKRPRARGAG